MDLRVVRGEGAHRLDGEGPFTELANRFLSHLVARAFSPATVRAYAYDLLNFLRFLAERGAPGGRGAHRPVRLSGLAAARPRGRGEVVRLALAGARRPR